MDKIQRAVVLALIKNKDGQILLQLRHDDNFLAANDKWEFPGGRIDFGESPEEAIVRECQEETGCQVTIIRLLPKVWSNLWTHKDGRRFQAVLVCYECELVSGEPKVMEKAVTKVGWFTPDEVYKMDCLPGIKEFIRLAI